MAHATIRFRPSYFLGNKTWVPYLTVRDADGCVIHADNGGSWLALMQRGARTVAALNEIEAIGHRTKHTWQELVDKAVI